MIIYEIQVSYCDKNLETSNQTGIKYWNITVNETKLVFELESNEWLLETGNKNFPKDKKLYKIQKKHIKRLFKMIHMR